MDLFLFANFFLYFYYIPNLSILLPVLVENPDLLLDNICVTYPPGIEIDAELFDLCGNLGVALANHLGEIVATRSEQPGNRN